MSGSWPLVGRGDEIALVGSLLASSHRGGQVLSGPPGVGKTRIGLESLELARRSGFPTAHVLATRASGALPLAAFAPLLPAGFAAGDPRDLLQRAQQAVALRSRSGPLVALIDDAHLLDETSAALVHHLVVTGSAFVIMTVRSGESVPEAITSLWKEGIVERIDVRPLGRGDVDRLLRAVLGGEVDGGLGAELDARCSGNVLFLRELVRDGLESGAIAERDGVFRLVGPLRPGERLTELVDSALRDLDPADRRALELVALSEPVDVDVLTRLELAEAVARLEQEGLVRVEAAGSGLRARLGHPLYGDVVRGQMSLLQSRLLTTLLADAVAGSEDPDDLLRVAVWRLDSGTPVATEDLLAAGHRAHGLGDPALALRLAEHADGFEATLLAGQALALLGRFAEAEQVWVAASDGDLTDVQRQQLTINRWFNLIGPLGDPDAGTALVAAQSALFTDNAVRDGLTGATLSGLATAGRWLDLAALYESLPPLEGLGRWFGAGTYAISLLSQGRCQEAQVIVDEEMARRYDLSSVPVVFRYGYRLSHAHIRLNSGRLLEAEAAAMDAYERVVAAGEILAQVWVCGMLQHAVMLQGRVADAVRWSRVALAAMQQLGHPASSSTEAATLVQSLAQLGDLEGARVAYEACPDGPGQAAAVIYSMHQARAWMAIVEGRLDVAEGELRIAAELGASGGSRIVELESLYDLVRIGRPAGVVGRLAELGQMIDGDLSTAYSDHAQALADSDGGALDKVSTTFEELHALLYAAEAAADAAVCWQRQGHQRNATASTRRAAALAAQCQGARTPALSAVQARVTLTDSQRRVTSRAAAGMSNKEIAEDLTLSVRTVENTLSRAYLALGIGGREELAAALREL